MGLDQRLRAGGIHGTQQPQTTSATRSPSRTPVTSEPAAIEGSAVHRQQPGTARSDARRPERHRARHADRLVPRHQRRTFRWFPRTLGLRSTAIAVGGLVGSALSGPVKHVTHPGRAMLITSATWGAALAGFGAVNGLAFVAYQHLDKSAPAVA